MHACCTDDHYNAVKEEKISLCCQRVIIHHMTKTTNHNDTKKMHFFMKCFRAFAKQRSKIFGFPNKCILDFTYTCTFMTHKVNWIAGETP